MSIALDFNTAMTAAAGTIIITDGAVQTVIDRATGEPTLRVVGATDTHTVSAASLVIEGSHVKLDVAGLLPGHTYSVVMGADALQSSGHVAFGGVRSTSQLTFTTPAAPDTQGPALVSVDTDGGVLKAGGSIAVTLKFSEAVATLPADALAAPHAGISNLTTSDGGITWHATLTAPADAATAAGNVLSLDMSKVFDTAGNHGSGTSSLASYAVDTQAPTATVTLDNPLLGGGRDAVATIKFSEAVAALSPDALNAGHATISNLHTTDGGTTWVATLSGNAATSANGNVLAVDLGQVKDLAGNAGSGSAVSAAYTVDTQGPNAVAIALDGATLANGKAVHATFTFAESVQNLSPDAISAPHATVSNLVTSDGGKTWTATLNASGTGTWTGNAVTVDLTRVKDLAGNTGSGGGASAPYTVDTQGPTATLVLDGAAVNAGGTLGLTVHFNEAVTDLTTAALQSPNATLTNLQHSADYRTWTATLAPQAGVSDVANTVRLDLAQVHDAAGNAGSGSAASGNYAIDTRGPGAVAIALDGATLGGGTSIHATFTFDEAVQDLPLAALDAPHARVTGLATADGGKTWTATLTADGSGTWTGNAIGIDLTQVKDLAGNAGSGSFGSAAYVVDTQAPGATLASDGTTATIHFTEAVTDLALAALQARNATLTNLQHSADFLTWTASLVPQGDGSHPVTLDLTQIHDAAGNAGIGSITADVPPPVDTTPPTVADILFDDTTIGSTHNIGFTITFSESVGGLTAAALQAPHAKVNSLTTTDGGRTWTGTLSADGSGTWTGNALSVDLTQVKDAAGNMGSGSATSLSHYDVNTAALTATVSLDGGTLVTGASVGLTVSFSAPVTALDASAFTTPHATLANLSHSADYRTWYATLTAKDPGVVADFNTVRLDLTGLHDTFGNAGAGTTFSGNYAYDTTVGAYVSRIVIDDEGPYDNDGITNGNGESVGGFFIGTLTGTQHVKVTLDDRELDSVYVSSSESGLTYWYYQTDALLDEGVHTYTASIVDDAGHASATVSKQITVDTTHPLLTGSPNGSTAFDVGGNLVLTFDQPVYWTSGESSYSGIQLYASGGSSIYVNLTDANFSSDRKTLTLTADELHLASGTDYTLYVPYSLTDLAGNTVQTRTIGFHTSGTYVDVTGPSATGARTSDYGTYGIGATVELRVTFSEPVNVTGTGAPVLHLSNGASATFQGMSYDHRSAVFEYTVAAGDTDVASLDVGSKADLAGHFADDAGNLLDLAHITFSHLASDSGYGGAIQIDGHAPGAPSAPKLDASSDTGTLGDNITSNTLATITGSGAEPDAWIELYVGDRLARSGYADDSGHWSFTDVLLGTNGVYTLKAVQYDDAYNESAPSQPLTITVAGSTAAVAALAAGEDTGLSATDNLTSHARPVLTGTVAAGTEVTVWDGSTILGTTTAGSDGVWQFTPLWNLAHGQHTIELALKDASGNVTARDKSVPFTFAIDLFEPGTPGKPVLAEASDTGTSHTDGITNDTTPTLTGWAYESGGQVEVYEGTTLLGKADVGADRTWTFTLGTDKAFTDGKHFVKVVQVDAAGNPSAPSAELELTIDTTAPTLTLKQPTTKTGQNWYNLTFSEEVVFAKNGKIDVLDSSNVSKSRYTEDVHTTWELAGNTLELNVNSLVGSYHLATDGNAIQDMAGNVAIIGSETFTVGLLY
ncbi:hypothetical protein IA69_16575 [Massilia sp. JS1662]|nr:hypothetical protein IA69_16575 [Massilia sp. JS1662]